MPFFGRTGFELVGSNQTGVTFENTLTHEEIASNRVLLNGSGVALGDVDGDGRVDIYFCRLSGPNVLYRNLGDWRFQDITERAGVACPEQYSTGAVFADIDGDGDLDLLVTAVGGPNAAFLNDGTGKFTPVPNAAGLRATTGATTLALADIDGDGDLDLYLTNYKKIRTKDLFAPSELGFNNIVRRVDNGFEISPRFKEHYTLEVRGTRVLWFETAEPDVLFENDGHGNFVPVTHEAFRLTEGSNGAATELKDWGLMARFQDLDRDGDPDLYVCNDFESPDRIWINDGHGRFSPIPQLAIRHTSNSSMAVDFSDIDGDGDLDFFVADMFSRVHQRRKTQRGTTAPNVHRIGQIADRPEYMQNTLFLNRGDQTYAEIAQYAGVQASEWSWSALFLDVDLDGYDDLFVTTGNYYDAQDMDTEEQIRERAMSGFFDKRNAVFMYPRLRLPNLAFRNRGDLTFEEHSREWGFDGDDISHGVATADLDGDGDLDLVINRFEQTAALFRNTSERPRIVVRLKGAPPNTQAVGAQVELVGGPRRQYREVLAGGVYLSHSDPLLVFAALEDAEHELHVTWRDGMRTVIRDVRANRIYEIDETRVEGEAPAGDATDQTPPQPFFADVSERLNHVHHEAPFDDFRRQPLLPNRLSQLGPGVAWLDLDRDGDDDLFLTNGKGRPPVCFVNDGQGGFQRAELVNPTAGSKLEQAAALGWWDSNGRLGLLVASSNYEEHRPTVSRVNRYVLNAGAFQLLDSLALGPSSPGPMATADYDGDGDLDLFVGGRVLPTRYPEPATSHLFKSENGSLKPDTLNARLLQNIGLVTGAVFSDLDGDSDPDLILTLEWGPVTVLRNERGRFENVTAELGLSKLTGWWNGVATGDFNEDGRPDLVATNWGLNSKYNLHQGQPLRLYYGDLDNNGVVDIFEAYYDATLDKIVPERDLNSLAQTLPFLRVKVRTHKRFSTSGLRELLGKQFEEARELQARTLATMVFINRGDRFEARPLPREAQFAPAFYVGVADFDGDGHEDLFLSQNFFASQPQTPRCDAGRGLWLKGNGQGQFEAVPGSLSGIKIYGEQRGAALADFDADARVDLVVSQNGARTKLYRNQRAKPGLRVRLNGPALNPSGIGAMVRILYADDRVGPAREIQGGAGYWSQNSPVQVLGLAAPPAAVEVRWPDGRVTRTPVTADATEIVIPYTAQ